MDPKRMAVFDFDEDDVVVEIQSAKSNAKFRKKTTTTKKKKPSPITKYTFLQAFSSSSTPLKEISNNKHVLQIPDGDDCSSSSGTHATLDQRASEPGSSGDDNVETALGNLRLESNISRRAGKTIKKSGLKQLRRSVFDPQWFKRQEEDKSLDIRHDETWNIKFDSDKSFKDVIYPKGDPDAVTISKRDLELLEPETFINDTIIDFYILYLKSNIQPEEKHRFHFFNSFFFRKLADLEKDPSSSCERMAAFQRVRKWTRNVNLFEKDYIFIPINYRLHWSLIVICHPGEAANCEDKRNESFPKGPCILHMDSIKGSHRDLKNLVQRFLYEEWKERNADTAESDSLRFLQLRFLELELPQQENLSDCGLFLLHYVERFLEVAPIYSSRLKNSELSNFLKKNWFPPAEASLKRHQIKKLLYDIIEQSREPVIVDCINLDESPQAIKSTDNEETGLEIFYGMSNSTEKVQGNCYSADAHGVRLTSPEACSSPSQIQCTSEWGRVADTSYLRSTANKKRSFMSPIQEEERMADPLVYIEACQKDTGLSTDLLPWDGSHGFSKNIEDNAELNSSSDMSSNGSEIFSVGGVNDDLLGEVEVFTCPRKPKKFELCSSWDLSDCVVQDSEEDSEMQDVHISSSPANQHVKSTGKNIVKEINILSSGEDRTSECDDWKTVKRRRVTHHIGRRRSTRSLMKALHL